MIDFYLKSFTEPPVNKNEIFRYTGEKKENPELNTVVDDCLKEILSLLSYRVTAKEFPVSITDDIISFPFFSVKSKDLSKNLNGCKSAVIFGATTGIETDRLISKYSVTSPLRAFIMQAVGTERIEALCDSFQDEIRRTYGYSLKPRFSPGYGDLPLEFQKEIFTALNLSKNIGLTLKNNLIMAPSKSVTAIIGVENENT